MTFDTHSTAERAEPVPRFTRLADWLAWQEGLHVREIELGLERCQSVARRMGLRAPNYRVITVGGTNGKGSSVALLDAILRAAGYRVGTYTSPHLLKYNERIRVDGQPVADDALCDAFARVDAARQSLSITYFEFGTLAALDLFQRSDLDVAVLEVGLGGRLDAVNMIDADVALLAAIGIDHVEWLGHDRETIAREKAGIFRAGRAAVCSDPNPPASMQEEAARMGADLYLLGRDFSFQKGERSWSWQGRGRSHPVLPRPRLAGDYQFQNAAGVLMALDALSARLPVSVAAIEQGLRTVSLLGRYTQIDGPVQYVLDVAHNPQAAAALVAALRENTVPGKTHCVLGMLKDKDHRSVIETLRGEVDSWQVVGLSGPRGAAAGQLMEEIAKAGIAAPASRFDSVDAALDALGPIAQPGDRVLVMGSFLTVAGAMRRLNV